MTPETFVNLIEQMIDLKIARQLESHMKTSQQVSSLIQLKREEDRQRLLQIKQELVRMLTR